MKFKKSYLILGSLLSATTIPMVAMSCATTKTDDKKPMEVKEDKEKDKQGTDKANTPASTPTDKSNTTDTSNQAGKTETPASGTGKAEGDSAGKAGSVDTAMSS